MQPAVERNHHHVVQDVQVVLLRFVRGYMYSAVRA
jgi:hypothetical protein